MLGESAEESSQIVVDGLRTRQIHPSIEEASPHVPHSLRGPDNGGSGSVWKGVPVSVLWKKVGASGGLGAASRGICDGVNEAGGKREMEPLWNEATMAASRRHVLERPL